MNDTVLVIFILSIIGMVSSNTSCHLLQRQTSCDGKMECWYDTAKDMCEYCNHWVCNQNTPGWEHLCKIKCAELFEVIKAEPTKTTSTHNIATTGPNKPEDQAHSREPNTAIWVILGLLIIIIVFIVVAVLLKKCNIYPKLKQLLGIRKTHQSKEETGAAGAALMYVSGN